MSLKHHLLAIGLLMTGVTFFLTWLATHTEVMFADGLRYVAAAKAIDQGSWKSVLTRAEDHPAYPLGIAAAHRLQGGSGPGDWQAAGQVAAVVAAVLLVIPLYLFALELYGAQTAWFACLLFYLVPLTGHVLADVLSEGTFLLFWTTGCWTGLRFLRHGSTPWLLASIGMASLAYLTRPEGALLPVALAATLGLMVLLPALRLPWPVWRRANLLLVVGPLLLAGPYVLAKGGIGTKPAVARLLGLSSRSHAMAVERERPLDPGQSTAATYRHATRAAARAIVGAVSAPLLVLAVAGLLVPGRKPEPGRAALFVVLVLAGWLMALVRLHATGGYCTPRHALLFAIPVIAAAAHGLLLLVECVSARLLANKLIDRRRRIRTALVSVFLVSGTVVTGRELVAPINASSRGYRKAGEWLAAHTPRDSRILDLKGWATFYGQRAGYSFGEVDQAEQDRELGWIVTHDAHLAGPWIYCATLRKLVGNRRPIVSFPEHRRPGEALVHIFDLSPKVARSGTPAEPGSSSTQR